jgi:ABC-2 type transport system ATP-binding protein
MTGRPERDGIIELAGVSKSFGQTRALIDVDLSVPAGTVQGLLGPNGAGKSTLVRVLATLLKPDSGHIHIAGVDVLKDPNTARTLIGLAGQFAAVDESLTGRENLIMVGQLYRLNKRVAKQRAEDTLNRLGLSDAADRQVQTYSGGMRRKLDLGASLVGEPRVLLLDEPTTGLDPRTRLDLWQFIRDLVAKGTTVLLTTQYLEEADQIADHIVVIDRGRSIASGSSEELKAGLASDLLEVDAAPGDLDRTVALLATIGSGKPTIDADTGRISIPVRNSVPDLMASAVLLSGAGIVPRDMGVRRPSLDDVFLALTGHPGSKPEAVEPPPAPTKDASLAKGATP